MDADKREYKVLLCKDPQEWTAWLEQHHAASSGVWLRLAKKASALQSVSYAQALDVALCYGWIDGQKKSYDESSSLQKFTPRGQKSLWSKVNREKVLALIDQFQDVAIYSQTGPDGKLYGVNMDGAGVLTVYNKDAFKKAGIETEPKTWGEFMAAFKKLKDAGFIPFGGDLSIENYTAHWLEAHVYNQLVWDTIYNWDDDKNKVISGKEVAVHFQKGDFMDWDAYLEYAHLFKEMVAYWPTGYEGKLDYRQLFRQGKVAMYMEGNWAVSQFKSSPLPFE